MSILDLFSLLIEQFCLPFGLLCIEELPVMLDLPILLLLNVPILERRSPLLVFQLSFQLSLLLLAQLIVLLLTLLLDDQPLDVVVLTLGGMVGLGEDALEALSVPIAHGIRV